ncbi:DUF1127 domain-containing protein [Rhizobium sp. RM]|uniref:DUF1127 domain-containing protein n=1 Tax=Rhizobium sp. RM TaxID=2748079 RepID=UPI00110E1E41|nr:DUF1127 domain-containing protein [Rhizobium sp. RM]NWJ24930.1 DUF1127 domain-containing protein [Rhizobium sp. RM]TMV16712.1 DUF1127 domain-containing protein [Rhizobium sp. Td3]
MRTAERRMELELATTRQSETWVRVAVRAASSVKTFLRRIGNRIAANELTELDDRLLADVGIARSDVMRALDSGLLEDPTEHLTRAARLRALSRFEIRRPD